MLLKKRIAFLELFESKKATSCNHFLSKNGSFSTIEHQVKVPLIISFIKILVFIPTLIFITSTDKIYFSIFVQIFGSLECFSLFFQKLYYLFKSKRKWLSTFSSHFYIIFDSFNCFLKILTSTIYSGWYNSKRVYMLLVLQQ